MRNLFFIFLASLLECAFSLSSAPNWSLKAMKKASSIKAPSSSLSPAGLGRSPGPAICVHVWKEEGFSLENVCLRLIKLCRLMLRCRCDLESLKNLSNLRLSFGKLMRVIFAAKAWYFFFLMDNSKYREYFHLYGFSYIHDLTDVADLIKWGCLYNYFLNLLSHLCIRSDLRPFLRNVLRFNFLPLKTAFSFSETHF